MPGRGCVFAQGGEHGGAELIWAGGGDDRGGRVVARAAAVGAEHGACDGGMRVDKVTVFGPDSGDFGERAVAGAEPGGKLALYLGERLLPHFVAALFAELRHPPGDLAAVPGQEVEQALEVAGDEYVHAWAVREVEFAPAVVYAGGDKVGEDVVLIAGAYKTLDRQAHTLRHPAGEDVAEVARGHAEIHTLARGYEPGVHEIAVGGEVIGYLRQQAAPVDGVSRGEEPALPARELGEGPVGEYALDACLRVVKVALDGAYVDVRAGLRDHLQPLHVAHAVARVEYHYLRARHVREALERRLARVAACGDKYADAELHAALPERSGEQAREHLQRHVLKGAGGAVPEL